jgi:hypothetical protein
MVTSVDFSSTSAANALAARSRSYGSWTNAFATQLNRLAALENLPAEARAAALARDPSLAAAAAKQEKSKPVTPRPRPNSLTWRTLPLPKTLTATRRSQTVRPCAASLLG